MALAWGRQKGKILGVVFIALVLAALTLTWAQFTNKFGDREVFDVKNYDDNYLGSASLTTATTYSDNSVYAELGLKLGTKKIAKMAPYMKIMLAIDIPMYEQWSGVSVRNEPTHETMPRTSRRSPSPTTAPRRVSSP